MDRDCRVMFAHPLQQQCGRGLLSDVEQALLHLAALDLLQNQDRAPLRDNVYAAAVHAEWLLRHGAIATSATDASACQAVLDAANQARMDFDFKARERWLRVLVDCDVASLALRFEACEQASDLFDHMGMSDDAIHASRLCFRIGRKIGNMRAVLFGLVKLSAVVHDQGRIRLALRLLARAERIATAVGNMRALSVVLGNKGTILKDIGRLDEAMAAYDQSEKIAKDRGDIATVSRAITNRSILLEMAGEYEQALACLEEADDLDELLKDSFSLAMNWGSRAIVLRQLGRYAEAREEHHRALDVFVSEGKVALEIMTRMNIGLLDLDEGNTQVALDTFVRCEAEGRRVDDLLTVEAAAHNQADALRQLGRFDEAETALGRSLELARSMDLKESVINSLMLRAELATDCCRVEAAIQDLRAAADMCEAYGLATAAGHARIRMAELEFELGRYDSCRANCLSAFEALDNGQGAKSPEYFRCVTLLARCESVAGHRDLCHELLRDAWQLATDLRLEHRPGSIAVRNCLEFLRSELPVT